MTPHLFFFLYAANPVSHGDVPEEQSVPAKADDTTHQELFLLRQSVYAKLADIWNHVLGQSQDNKSEFSDVVVWMSKFPEQEESTVMVLALCHEKKIQHFVSFRLQDINNEHGKSTLVHMYIPFPAADTLGRQLASSADVNIKHCFNAEQVMQSHVPGVLMLQHVIVSA